MPTFQQPVQDGQILLIATVRVDSSERSYGALFDTGAQRTMVSPKVVEEAGLEAISYTSIVPVSGKPIQTPKYRINLGIPITQGSARLLVATELEVARLPYRPNNFDILLGMDFLTIFHFTMYDGLFILSN